MALKPTRIRVDDSGRDEHGRYWDPDRRHVMVVTPGLRVVFERDHSRRPRWCSEIEVFAPDDALAHEDGWVNVPAIPGSGLTFSNSLREARVLLALGWLMRTGPTSASLLDAAVFELVVAQQQHDFCTIQNRLGYWGAGAAARDWSRARHNVERVAELLGLELTATAAELLVVPVPEHDEA